MVVWTGRGIFGILVFAFSFMIWTELYPKGTEDSGVLIASILAGIFCWFLGNKWNNVEPKIVIDEKTGEKIAIKENHSIFWIKMQYWGVIFLLLALYYAYKVFI